MLKSIILENVIFTLGLLSLAACAGQPLDPPAAATEPAPTVETKTGLIATVSPIPSPAPTPTAVAAIVEQSPTALQPEPSAETIPATEARPATETEPVEAEAMVEAEPVGPTPAQQALLDNLTVKGVPPELYNEIWLNSDPLKLAELRGQVVIVEFWTYGCINCKNVIPSLREWYQKYTADGLVIVGVHTPEFGHERDLENVKEALGRLDVPYPVAIDNDWATWRAYNNHYWPAKYFIDKTGNIRHIHIGEGRYQEQEEIIRALLAEG